MFSYEVSIEPDQADVEAVMRTIIAADREAHAKDGGLLEWAIFLTDSATGEKTGGGITGYTAYDWMYVQFIAVPPELRGRGIGGELMARAEALARQRGLVGIFLDTFEFQARPFYEKLGFTLFGQIEDHPRGLHRYFLKKRLDAAPALNQES